MYYNISDRERWVGIILVGQLGNQLWQLASTHGISKQRHANWCLVNWNPKWEKYKHALNWVTSPPDDCKGVIILHYLFWFFSFFQYISDGGDYAKYNDVYVTTPYPRIVFDGNLQSYKYFDPVTPIPFRLKAEYLAKRWVNSRDVYTAIHIRRGDKLWDYGNVVPPLHYYVSAMATLAHLFPLTGLNNSNFVVVTDDMKWVGGQSLFSGMQILNTHEDPSFDMAVIAACKHKILSIGTFGWWGAYLGDTGDNRTSAVIYPVLQMAWPKASGFDNSDYFPPHWTGIDYALES